MSCDAQPSLFYCKETDVAVEVHVDDFDIAGPDEAVEELVRKLQQIFLMKVGEPLGPGCSSEFLGRRKVRTEEGLFTAPSRRLIDDVLSLVDLSGCRPVTAPMEKMKAESSDCEELGDADAQIYRSVVGKLLFISKDRPDLGFTVKELCRDIRGPNKRSWRRLKRCLRYLAGSRDLGIFMQQKKNTDLKKPKVEVFADSDWVGLTDIGPDMRKSTSGCLIFIDGVLVAFYSRTQKQTAMSSCEAGVHQLGGGHVRSDVREENC